MTAPTPAMPAPYGWGSAPKLLLNTLLSIFLGTLLAVGYALVRELLDELRATAYSTICPHGRPVMLPGDCQSLPRFSSRINSVTRRDVAFAASGFLPAIKVAGLDSFARFICQTLDEGSPP